MPSDFRWHSFLVSAGYLPDTKLILPINEKPSIISGIHYAYPCAIIESRKLVEISLMNSDESFSTYLSNVEVDFQNRKIFINQVTNKDMDAILYRDCADEDEITICVDYIKPFTKDRYVDLFVCSGEEKNIRIEKELEDKTCGFRWNQYGFFLKKKMFAYDTKKYKYIKMKKKLNV